MSQKQPFTALAIFLLALFLGACGPASTLIAGQTKQIPEITIRARDYFFVAPEQIAASLMSITLINGGHESHHAQVARLNDGVTTEQIQAALRKGPEAAFPLMTFVGGPGLVDPGLLQQVTLELGPGQYMLLCIVRGHDGVTHLAKGMVTPIRVVAPTDQAYALEPEPEADAMITLLDFWFLMPSETRAGKQVWQIVNEGQQIHDLVIVKLAEGKTRDDVMAFLRAPGGEPPFANVGGIQAINPGETGWLNLDLEPGNYMALCRVPDPNSGVAHEFMGMTQAFTVKE